MRVLIAPDKFKGTLRAAEAAEAIAAGWREARPGDELELLPISDGGDGFGEVLGELLGAEVRQSKTVNAAHEPIEAQWWWSGAKGAAIVETARINGLAMLPAGKFHPFELDTFGVGSVLREVSAAHPGARITVGIGGSATNDGGFGMARGLGYVFLDHSGKEITRWPELPKLEKIKAPAAALEFGRVVIATDVQNRLLGPEGATRVYGPQKGLKQEEFEVAELCLERLAQVARLDLKIDAAEEPGTGAAGGLGYGLRVFLGGEFKAGFSIFAELAGLEERIAKAALVITGEGSIDRSTLMGKGTGAVAEMARKQGRNCYGLAGHLPDLTGAANQNFTRLWGIHPHLTSIEEAKANAREWLEKLAAEAARSMAA